MARQRPHAPPARDGVAPSCVVITSGDWPTLLDFFVHRFPSVNLQTWQKRLAQGDVTDAQGVVAHACDPATPGRRLYYYRELPHEPPIPFDAVMLYRDSELLVVDKPHFLPVVPSGKYVRETVLARLVAQLDLPTISPIHRIDRDTAGLVLFSVNPRTRNTYHALFRNRAVQKTYHCIAPWKPELLHTWPLRRESHITGATHFMQQTEASGPANAITTITPVEVRGGWARYQLQPLTGQRHQLRVHMHALGLPIQNDGIYPTLTPESACDYSRPLQLLAQSLVFADPITGQPREFRSQRQLAW